MPTQRAVYPFKSLQTSNINSMNKIDGLQEAFQKAKIIYMITYGDEGEEHSRPMTNFNDDPYHTIWLTTYTDTQKVRDIKKNNKTLILFPSDEDGKFYELAGHSEFEHQDVVKERWEWWYLYWHPNLKPMYWFSQSGRHPERCIINFTPESARVVNVRDLEYIYRPYKSIVEK
jgi:general stress protein 26